MGQACCVVCMCERENVMCVRKFHVFVDMYIKSYGMPHALDLEVLNQPLGIEFDPP